MLLVPFFQNVAADFKAAAAAAFTCDAADFDGTNDLMLRGGELTGNADAKVGILRVCLRIDGGDGVLRRVFSLQTGSGSPGLSLLFLATNKIRLAGNNAAGTSILRKDTTPTYTAGATWLTISGAWNLATPESQLYVGDSAPALDANVNTDDTLDYTKGNCAIGAQGDGAAKFNGCLAEIIFWPATYASLDTEANRRLLVGADGKPVDPAAAIAAWGTPIVHQHIDDGGAAADFATNLGSGGDFTITGTLDVCDSSPTD